MNKIKTLISRLCELRLAPVSSGADKLVNILKDELPFKITEYVSGEECNGWVRIDLH